MIANTVLIVKAQAIIVQPINVVDGHHEGARTSPNHLNHLVIVRQTNPLEYSGVTIISTLNGASETKKLNSQI